LRQGSRLATVASSGHKGGEGTQDDRHLLTIVAGNRGDSGGALIPVMKSADLRDRDDPLCQHA
jgi:hypothetical protein